VTAAFSRERGELVIQRHFVISSAWRGHGGGYRLIIDGS
jgi:hypothetical protein